MRSHMIQQYKKIKNSPMRSPSPDYSCRNRSKTSHMPLEESHILCNSKMNKNTAVQFPIIPMQVLRKKNSCDIENIKPQKRGQEKQNQGSTALPKKQRITLPNAQISIFSVSSEELHKDQKQQLDYIFRLIQQIYSRVFTHIQQSEKPANQLSQIIRKLEAIKEKVNEQISKSLQPGCKKLDQQCSFTVHEGGKNSRIFQQIKGQLESSPIKNRDNHEEDSLSIFQIHQILSENNKLKKQLTALKLQFEGSHEKRQPDSRAKEMEVNDWYLSQHKRSAEQLNKQGIIWQGAQNDSSFSSTTVQFLKQKITFLQNQLENQFEKWSQMQSQKQIQISTLKRRIAEISDFHQKEAEKYRFIIEQQNKGEFNKNYEFKQIPKRSRINSQTIKRQQSQIEKISQQPERVIIQARKALSWDKQQVVSICDQSQHQEESQYSQAQRIDIENMFATRRQTSKKEKEREKAHYEQIIANNTIKYHQQLQILQQQLLQLRQYLEQQDLDSDVEHKKCANCNQSINAQVEFSDRPDIMQLQREINLLRNQIVQEKKQNGKLREIISKAIEKGEAKVQGRTRGRKLQKLSKRSIKSDNQSEIQTSQIMDDANMSLILQAPSNKLKNSGV